MISRGTLPSPVAPGPDALRSQHVVEGGPAGRGVCALAQTLSHAQMNAAIEEGKATSPLLRQDLLRFEQRWWQLARGGAAWLEVSDESVVTACDRDAAGMTPERAEAQRAANIRAAARC